MSWRSRPSCHRGRSRRRKSLRNSLLSHRIDLTLVDSQREDVRTCVVPDDVKIEASSNDVIEVEGGVKDALLAPQRTSQHVAERRDDHAAALYEHGRVVVGQRTEVGRVVGAHKVLTCAKHETADRKSTRL